MPVCAGVYGYEDVSLSVNCVISTVLPYMYVCVYIYLFTGACDGVRWCVCVCVLIS